MTKAGLPDQRGRNPASRKNLKVGGREGQNPNANGYSLTSRLKQCLNKPLEDPGKNATAGELLVHATLKAAIATKAVPFIEVWNRAEGKVPGDVPVIQNLNVVFVVGKGYQEAVIASINPAPPG